MSNKLRLQMHSLSIFYFAITLTVLLISPLSLFLQTSSFSLSLDLDSSDGDQAVQSLVVPPPPAYRIVSIQIFGTDVQNARRISTRFEYDGTQVVYAGFDAGDVLPNPDVMVSKGINPTSVEITMSSGDSAMVNSGLIGTIRFRTTDVFSETEIRLVRAELVRDGTSEIMMLAHSVNLQVSAVLFPDFDGNGKVDIDDFRAFSGAYGSRRGDAKYKSSCDLDGDGEIGLDDFQIFINSYGKVAPVAVGTLAPMLLGEHPVIVDVSGNFSDADSGTLRYAAVSSADSVATASVDGHAVTVHPVTVGVATITVTATDADGLHAMQDITVTVRFPLAFAASTTRRALDENTPPGEQIGEPVAVRGFNSLTYRLNGTDADSFAIDARTGQIQTREGISYDFETKNSYWMTVEANDGQGGTTSIVVIIKINDVEEPPSLPPSNFLVIPDNESLMVHYSAVSNEQGRPPVRGYHAEIRRGENGPWGTRKTIYGRNNTSVYYHHIDPEGYHSRILVNGQLYQVRVRAYNSEGASDWSKPVSGTPIYVPPKEEPKLVQFQGEGDMASADIDLSFSTGEGGRIKVMQAALPDTISQEEVEGIFVEIVEVEVSNAPDVPAQAGFTISGSSLVFDINLRARVNNRDVDIGDALQASVEICLPVPEDISDPVIVHYAEDREAWEMLDRQRVDGGLVCGYTDIFSLFGVGLRVNRAPVVVGAIEPQTLRVGGEGVTVDVSGNFHDPDSDVLTYTAVSSDEAIATVDVSGSMVRITPVAEGSATITVTATDTDEDTVELTFSIMVEPANQVPHFTSSATFDVQENITNVGTVAAEDADANDDIEAYAIIADADGSQFSIVAATGVLTFKTSPNYESPTDVEVTTPSNAAEDNEYIVIVTATGGAGSRALTARDTITVTVTDVNEPPGKPSDPIVSASTVNSLTISWTAPTNTGPEISAYDVRYILTSASAQDKSDDNNWTVQTDAWTSGSLAYTISSLNQNTGYDIQVRAKSAEGTGTWSDSVTGTTTQNQAPVFASISPISVAENSTVSVATVSATDADSQDNITGYDIVTGADGSQFSIVASTGVLSFKVAPNYEDPKDVEVTTPSNAADNNEYIVVVSATSGANARALTATQTITVTVTDVTEPPGKPSAPIVSASTVNSLTVSWTAPTNTGPEISAYDVRYILTSASAQDKADDNNWTVQTDAWTSGSLRYTISSLPQNTGYDIQVRAENAEGTGAWSDSVTGTTAQNRAPVFASISPISVAENSTVSVATVSATDADSQDNITGYAIVTGADGSQFSIVASTGVLSFKVAPNYEDPKDVEVTTPSNAAEDNEYIVIVSATSGANARVLSATQTITVTVTDVTEPPGKPSAPTVSGSTVNSLTVSWIAPTNTGPEISAYDVRYILTSASAQDKADDNNWTVQTDAWTSGSLRYTISSLPQNTGYDIQVRAENAEGTGAWSDSVTGTTTQNQAPVITSASSFTVSENSTGTIATVSATDADSQDNITGYAIVTGADGSQFSIVASTGVLSFKVAPNYEDPKDVEVTTPSNAAEDNEYIVVVSATSGANARVLSATQTITVTVTDVTEAPGKPSAPTVASETFNSLTVSWTAPTNTGPEISAYDVRYILTSANAQDKADDSKWTVQTDAWTDGSLEYTISSLPQNTGYDIQVRAENAEGTGAWSDSVTGTTAQNRAPVFASVSPISVAENSTVSVATVSATDADSQDNITGYAIVTGADGSQFSIVASTGVLSFKVAPNYEDPKDVEVTTPSNAAEDNEYIVVVSATSGANARALTATQTITVTVTDVTEAPGKPSAPTVASATFNSLTISWTAPTNTGPVISAYDVRYILTSASAQDKADNNNWTVQTDAWTSGSLEYMIGSLDENTSYDIQVRAESDEGTGAWSDSVTGMTGIIPGICGRTSQVQSVILDEINGVTNCAVVTKTHLAGIRNLDFRRQNITAVKANDFSDLSRLRVLRLDINKLSTLPANVFSGLSSLRTLRLNNNKINTLPDSVFSGLSSPGPTRLTLDNNLGAPFTLTLVLNRTDNTDLTASGPATIKVKVAEGAPFDMTVSLSVTGGTLTGGNGSAVTVAMISAGSTESAAITVTQSGAQPVIVSLTGDPPAPPAAYEGLTTALGSSLVLFGEAGICDRTSQVQSAILSAIDGIADCALVMDEHLALISSLNLHDSNISTLLQNDFSMLSNLQNLWLYDNDLVMLPSDVFTDLSSLQTLSLYSNQLSALPADAFSGLDSLQTLHLDSNQLSALPADAFSDLDSLQTLSLSGNRLSALPTGVFSGLSSLQILNFNGNGLSTLPADAFSGLSSLQILNFNGNGLNTLPTGVFSGLSNLQSLYFNGNRLSTLPAGVFSGLSSLRHLDLSDNTGAPFTLTLQLDRTDNTDLTASGPATIKVKVAEGAPFDMTVGLSATNGTLTGENSSVVTVAMISAGSTESAAITVTQGGSQPVRVSLTGKAPAPPMAYAGLKTVLGSSLVLFGEVVNRVPEAVRTIPEQTLTEGGDAVTVDVSIYFSDPDKDDLTYEAVSSDEDVVTVAVSDAAVEITPQGAGSATVTVTASDPGSLSATQEMAVSVKNTPPVVDVGLTDQAASANNAFTYTFPTNAFSDADNDVLTYTSIGQPTWLTFTANTRTYSGTPPDTNGSPFAITVTANDGKGSKVQATFVLTIPIGICDRTTQIQAALLSVIDGVTACTQVTDAHLSGIADSLNLRSKSITALKATDFSGLSSLRILNVYDNDLTVLPTNVFSDLSNLRFLSLYDNGLTALPTNVFSDLSNLRFLSLDNNEVSTLPAGVFADLSNLQTLSLGGNGFSTLPAGVFSDLSNLRFLSLDNNEVSTLPDNVFSNLSNLQTLSLGSNKLSTLPAGVFSGLSSLRHLDLSDNTGAPFTLTLQLDRTDNTDLTASGPATIKVKVAEGAPFDMTVGLSATNGTLTGENGSAVTVAMISAGSTESAAVTVTQSGSQKVTVSLTGNPPAPPAAYAGLTTALGSSLVLFSVNRVPEAVGTIPAQTLTATGDPETTGQVTLDVSSYFSDPDNDPLTYYAESNKQDIAFAFAINSEVIITAINEGTATVTVTARDVTGSNMSVDQTIAVTVTVSSAELCNRTSQVQSAILAKIDGVADCSLVKQTHLFAITDTLNLSRKSITALKANDFSGLSRLGVLYLHRNALRSLPAEVFSGLSSLETLRLNHNQISTLPDSVFSGLSSPGLTRLTLNNNSGAPFTLTLQLERTDNTDATASGPATIVVKVAEGAPFDMTVGLSVTNGTLTDENGSAVTGATISAGSTESAAITVTQSGSQKVTVSLTGNPPVPPTAYRDLNTALGSSLVLF